MRNASYIHLALTFVLFVGSIAYAIKSNDPTWLRVVVPIFFTGIFIADGFATGFFRK
jgi:hypothetical protein